MPYTDFTRLLTEIQQKNLGQGLILAAQAQMMANQDKALEETLAQYNAAQIDFNKKFMTTSEQLEELNKSDVLQEGGAKIEELATNYMAMLDMVNMQQNELRGIVDTAQQRLINIGTDEAIRQAQTIEKSYNEKVDILKSKVEAPLKTIQFKRGLLDVKIATLNAETSEAELSKLKTDIQVMENVAKVMADDRKNKPYPTWLKVIENLRVNNDTGKIDFKEVFENFLEGINADPDIPEELKPKVISVFYSEMNKNLRHYNPPSVVNNTSTSGIEGMLDDLKETTDLYDWLKKESRNVYEILHSDRFADFRSSYYDVADQYIAELKEAGKEITPEKEKELRTPGRNFEVLKRYNQAVKDGMVDVNLVDVGLGLPNTPDGLATYMYNLNYNPNNDYYYWKQLNRFKKKIGLESITPLSSEVVPETGLEAKFHNVVNLTTLFGVIPFDLGVIMSNDGEFYLPSYGNYPPNVKLSKPDLESREKPKPSEEFIDYRKGKQKTLFEMKGQ